MRHARSCPAGRDREAGCDCEPSYEASVFDVRTGKKVRRSFRRLALAKAWRAETIGQVRRGELTAATVPALRKAAEAFLSGIESGAIRKKGGERYSPRVVNDYRRDLRDLVETLGAHRRLNRIDVDDVERLVRDWRAEGLSESRISNRLKPLRVIYRQHRRTVPVNPLAGLEIGSSGKRERAAGDAEIAELLAPLDAETRLAYALAGYAGLRAGEIAALDVADVRIADGVLSVHRSWCHQTRTMKAPKSKAGTRRIPLRATGPLLRIAQEHQALSGRTEGLLLGPDGQTPVVLMTLHRRAKKAWEAENGKRAEKAEREGRELRPDELLVPITLHELRHSCGSRWAATPKLDPAMASKWFGDTYATFANVYVHAIDRGDDDAAAKVEAAYFAEVVA